MSKPVNESGKAWPGRMSCRPLAEGINTGEKLASSKGINAVWIRPEYRGVAVETQLDSPLEAVGSVCIRHVVL